jgi:hypothetical protein
VPIWDTHIRIGYSEILKDIVLRLSEPGVYTIGVIINRVTTLAMDSGRALRLSRLSKMKVRC